MGDKTTQEIIDDVTERSQGLVTTFGGQSLSNFYRSFNKYYAGSIPNDILNKVDSNRGLNDNEKSIYLEGLRQIAGRKKSFIDAVNTPGFRIFEKFLIDRLIEIDHEEFWSAYERGDKEEEKRLYAERTGIMILFNKIHSATKEMDEIEERLKAVQSAFTNNSNTLEDDLQG